MEGWQYGKEQILGALIVFPFSVALALGKANMGLAKILASNKSALSRIVVFHSVLFYKIVACC